MTLPHDDVQVLERCSASPEAFHELCALFERKEPARTAPSVEHASLQKALDHAPVLVWQIDRDARIRFVAGGLLARSVAEYEGKSALVLAHTAALVSSVREALSGQANSVIEPVEDKVVEFTWQPLCDESGANAGAVGFAIDVSARHKPDEDLWQARRLETLGQLVGGVAHDFNNLLTVILTYADALQYDMSTADPRRKDVDEIRAAAGRAATLTRQLLAFSRREAANPRTVDINRTLDDLAKMIRRLIGENIEVKFVTDDELGQVFIDPGRVEQLILRLVVYARDLLAEGGVLTLETANALLDAERARAMGVEPGRFARLSIAASTVVGQSTPRPPSSFGTPALQGDSSLSTVIDAVQEASGAVSIEPFGERGTRLDVFLPWDQSSESHFDGAGSTAEPATSNEVVLLVEDDPALRRLATRVLRDQGYAVLTARDGEHALAKANMHPTAVNVLVTDVVMPRMGGEELATLLRTTYPAMRVLFTSGYPDRMPQLSKSAPGADTGVAFLPKPYTRLRLLGEVRRLLGS